MIKRLSFEAVRKLIKDAGADEVSKDAVEYLRRMLEDEAKRITAQACKVMELAGRKRLLVRDLQFLTTTKVTDLSLKDVDLSRLVNKQENMVRNKARTSENEVV